eukprot:8479436-Pyramimonas_sp.AAC.2
MGYKVSYGNATKRYVSRGAHQPGRAHHPPQCGPPPRGAAQRQVRPPPRLVRAPPPRLVRRVWRGAGFPGMTRGSPWRHDGGGGEAAVGLSVGRSGRGRAGGLFVVRRVGVGSGRVPSGVWPADGGGFCGGRGFDEGSAGAD